MEDKGYRHGVVDCEVQAIRSQVDGMWDSESAAEKESGRTARR